MSPASDRSKHFPFTINNYTDDDLVALRSAIDAAHITYICWQLEVGANGTPHTQGYAQADIVQRFTQINRILGGRAYLSEARGDSDENHAYCCKEDETTVAGSFEEYGVRRFMHGKKVKKRNREDEHTEIIKDIKDGMDIRSIITKYPGDYMKYHAAIDKIYALFARKPVPVKTGPWRWELPENFKWGETLIIFGPINIGKTEWAKSLFPNPLFVSHIDMLKRYDPTYHGGIIFDDMSFTHLHRDAVIALLDIDNVRSIHVRYGIAEIPANTKKIIVTNLNDIVPPDETNAISRRMFWHRIQ